MISPDVDEIPLGSKSPPRNTAFGRFLKIDVTSLSYRLLIPCKSVANKQIVKRGASPPSLSNVTAQLSRIILLATFQKPNWLPFELSLTLPRRHYPGRSKIP